MPPLTATAVDWGMKLVIVFAWTVVPVSVMVVGPDSWPIGVEGGVGYVWVHPPLQLVTMIVDVVKVVTYQVEEPEV